MASTADALHRAVKTNLDFTEARDSERQLSHMQVCTLLQTNKHASTQSLSFLQAGCGYCKNRSETQTARLSGFLN